VNSLSFILLKRETAVG